MIITTEGYELVFRHRERSKNIPLKETFYYIFFTTSGEKYVVLYEYYMNDVFAVKFFPRSFRKSHYKYNKLTNSHDAIKVLKTIGKAIPSLLQEFPHASFSFCGARLIDIRDPNSFIEPLDQNQRFRIFSAMVQSLIGFETFYHVQIKDYSSYLLLNKQMSEYAASIKAQNIIKMFCDHFAEFPDYTQL